MKKIWAISFLMFVAILSQAQNGYYNVLLEYTGAEYQQCQHIQETSYTVGADTITEYFCTEGKGLICIHTTGDELPHYSKIKFIRKKKDLSSLISKIGLKKALSFTYDKLTPGMTVEEVRILLGKPTKMKYSIDNADQLLHFTYNYGLYKSLVFRNEKLEKIIY